MYKVKMQSKSGSEIFAASSEEEVIQIVKSHVADLIDVEVTDITLSAYSEDFMNVFCVKIEKTKNPRRWIKDESYRDPAPELE